MPVKYKITITKTTTETIPERAYRFRFPGDTSKQAGVYIYDELSYVQREQSERIAIETGAMIERLHNETIYEQTFDDLKVGEVVSYLNP